VHKQLSAVQQRNKPENKAILQRALDDHKDDENPNSAAARKNLSTLQPTLATLTPEQYKAFVDGVLMALQNMTQNYGVGKMPSPTERYPGDKGLQVAYLGGEAFGYAGFAVSAYESIPLMTVLEGYGLAAAGETGGLSAAISAAAIIAQTILVTAAALATLNMVAVMLSFSKMKDEWESEKNGSDKEGSRTNEHDQPKNESQKTPEEIYQEEQLKKSKESDIYEPNPKHDPNSSSYGGAKSSVEPENAKELWEKRNYYDKESGTWWTVEGKGNKAIYTRFSSDNAGKFHYSGSSNGINKWGEPVPLKKIPQSVKNIATRK